MKFLNDFFNTARKNGLATLEQDLDEPDKSALFKRHPNFYKDKEAMHFFCDTMRTLVTGGVETHDLDQIMETDLEILHRQGRLSANALTTVADSLPGLGIVAAVLGVVITMGSLGGPPEEIGHKVAAALVGTFLGILLCYGFLGPVAAHIKKHTDAEGEYFLCLRMGLLANMKGLSPMLALEAARRAIPHHLRPDVSGDGQGLPQVAGDPGDGGGGLSAKSNAPIIIVRKRSADHDERARRGMEGGLRGFCHRDDGAVHCSVAVERQRKSAKGSGRIFPGSHGKGPANRHDELGRLGKRSR